MFGRLAGKKGGRGVVVLLTTSFVCSGLQAVHMFISAQRGGGDVVRAAIDNDHVYKRALKLVAEQHTSRALNLKPGNLVAEH